MFAGPVPCKALFITARMVTPQPASRTPNPEPSPWRRRKRALLSALRRWPSPFLRPRGLGPGELRGSRQGCARGWAPAQSPGDSGSMWPGWGTTGCWRGNFQGDGACAAARAAPVEPGGDDGFLEGRTTNGPGGGKGTPCGAGDQPCACASEGYRRARARV